MGIADKSTQILLYPSKEVILMFDTKLEGKSAPSRYEDYEKFEDIGP